MRKLIFFASLLLISSFAKAQSEYDDLLELIVDEKYEKCLIKALGYTEKDETKKHPLPYLYMSMAFFKIHQSDDPKLAERYPNAFKESLKYAVKYRKKDKESEYYGEYLDYFSELRKATIEDAELQDDNEKYTRSKGQYKYLTDIDPNDAGAWLMKGYTEWKLKSNKDAGISWEQAKTILTEVGCDGLQEEQLYLLKKALILTAEMKIEEGDRSSAKEWMELGKDKFGEDKEFMVTYREIVG
jgi:hypothetical protein